MAARKPKLAVVPAEAIAVDRGPEGLEPKFRELYQQLIDEIIVIRGAATQADIILIRSVAEAAQGEEEARNFAREARDSGLTKSYLAFNRMAQAEARTKSGALGCLGLSGDRRGASEVRRAAHAIRSGAETRGSRSGKWTDL